MSTIEERIDNLEKEIIALKEQLDAKKFIEQLKRVISVSNS